MKGITVQVHCRACHRTSTHQVNPEKIPDQVRCPHCGEPGTVAEEV